jgi:predicted ATPase
MHTRRMSSADMQSVWLILCISALHPVRCFLPVPGKTAVVDELQQHVLAQRGLFARAKFEPARRDSSCLMQAFRTLVVQLMIRDAPIWRMKILRAVGSQAAVLIDVIPELLPLLGSQPPVTLLSSAESSIRFAKVFLHFVGCLSSPAAPLVLFLDQLCRADSGSMALMKLLLSSPASVLVIGGYRYGQMKPTKRNHAESAYIS